MDKIDPKDWKYVPVDPEPGFDPEHNKRVIEGTIKKTDALRRKKQREYDEKTRERTDAIATYLDSIKRGKSTSSIEKYFGRRELARLRGQEILEQLKHAKEQKKGKKA